MGPVRTIALLAFLVGAGVARAGMISFADLARHTQYKMVKISPDGVYIAATSERPNGQIQLVLIDLVRRKGAHIAPSNGDDVLDFWWASRDYVVFDVAEHLGGWTMPVPTGDLYRVKSDGSDATKLYGYPLQSGVAQFLSRIDGDPDQMLVAVTESGASGWSTVQRMDVRSGAMRRVVNAPMRYASFLADHRGNVRFAFSDDLEGNRLIYMRAVEGDDWERLEQASANRDWPIAFSADDKLVWFTCPGSPTGFGVCRFDPANRAMTHVWSNPHVEATTLSQGLAEDSVAGVEFTDGRPAISVFDNDAPGVKALVELMKQYPGEDVHFVSGTDNGSRAIALVEADVDPGMFFLYDKESNTFTLLLERAKWIDPNQLGRTVPFSFAARDGLQLQGYVTYPPGKVGAKNLPMVVFVHGGPYGIRDRWEYDPYVQAMATRGYAVLQVNYRGSGGYGFGFEQAGWRQWGGKMQDDVTDATRWAIVQGIADPNRICIYGGSYGGYAALEGAVKEPDLYKCAIGYVGVYDLRMMYKNAGAPRDDYARNYVKRTLGTDITALAQRSPIYQLNILKAKVMLIVGGRDTVVPRAQGKNMHEALIKRGVEHEWLYKPDEWHGFYDENNIAELFQKVDAFLAANIGPSAGSTATTSAEAVTH